MQTVYQAQLKNEKIGVYATKERAFEAIQEHARANPRKRGQYIISECEQREIEGEKYLFYSFGSPTYKHDKKGGKVA